MSTDGSAEFDSGRPESGLEMVPSSFNLLRYFTATSLVVLLVASLSAGMAAAWLVHSTAMQVERDEADSLAENFVTFLGEEGFGHERWLAAEAVPDDLRARLRARLDNFGVREFTLLSRDGRVLEDFGPNRGEGRPVWDSGLKAAQQRRVALRWERERIWPLAPFDTNPSGEVEAFIPILKDGDLLAVARVRRNLSPVLTDAHAMSLRILLLAAVAGLLVFAVLWFLVRRADRLLRRQSRFIERACAELELYNRLLEDVSRRKDEFYLMCSSDLRAPLLAVRAACGALLEDESPPLAGPQRQLVGECRRNSETVLDLMDHLLDLARMESGDGEVQEQSMDIAAILRSVIVTHRVLADGMKADVDLACPFDTLPVRGDRPKVTRAFSTLLSNAIMRGTESKVVVAVESSGDEARVHFTDHGPPIAVDAQEELFDSDPPSRGGGSEGVGSLSIVRALLECQRGTVTVVSDVNSPTTFTVTLPLSADGASPS